MIIAREVDEGCVGMPWWQILLAISFIAMALGIVYSMRVAREVEQGKEFDRGVSGTVSKHKIRANPIFWSFLVFIVIIFIATVYFIFLYPRGAY